MTLDHHRTFVAAIWLSGERCERWDNILKISCQMLSSASSADQSRYDFNQTTTEHLPLWRIAGMCSKLLKHFLRNWLDILGGIHSKNGLVLRKANDPSRKTKNLIKLNLVKKNYTVDSSSDRDSDCESSRVKIYKNSRLSIDEIFLSPVRF